MWYLIEPVIKYLFLLFALRSVLPSQVKKKKEIAGTLFYGTVVMAGIEWVTGRPFVMPYSYGVYLILMFVTALLWVSINRGNCIRLALPYICFYTNFIVCIRVFSESMTGTDWRSTAVAVLMLTLTNLFFHKNRMTELTYVTKTQYMVTLVSPAMLFISYEFWRIYSHLQMSELIWVALFHYCMNLLMLHLVATSVREYQEVVRLGLISKKREFELAEQNIGVGLVRQYSFIRHEFKNICFRMQVLLKEKRYEELENLITHYTGEKLEYNELINTGKHMVNIILSQKIREARLFDINIVTKVLLNETLPLSDDELGTILSNLIDNAIEASKKETEKDIRIEMNSVKDFIQIMVKNKVGYDVLEKNPYLKTTKEEARFHGIGLSIIREIVQQHNGKLDYRMKGGYFEVTIYL